MRMNGHGPKGLVRHRDGLPPGWTGMRYPGGDPENGAAYRQRWTGVAWECAECSAVFDEQEGMYVCTHCGQPMPVAP